MSDLKPEDVSMPAWEAICPVCGSGYFVEETEEKPALAPCPSCVSEEVAEPGMLEFIPITDD